MSEIEKLELNELLQVGVEENVKNPKISEIEKLKLNEIFLKICAEENVKNPKISVSSMESNGFMALISKATISSDEDPSKILNLFIKRSKPSPMAFLYANEADFYTKTLEKYKEMAKEFSGLSTPSVPKCYYADKDLVILENLICKGFDILEPLMQPLQDKHIRMILKEFAKLHAFSFTLKDKNLAEFENLGPKFEVILSAYDNFASMGFFDSLIEKTSAAFSDDKDSKYLKAFKNFLLSEDGLLKFLNDEHRNERNNVFAHGDPWTWNFMFNGDEICMVDFQCARKLCPVVDLAMLFANSACSQENLDNIEKYLKFYHDELQMFLGKMHGPVAAYTWEDLLDDWKNRTFKAVFAAGFVNKMLIMDKEEIKEREHIPLVLRFNFTSKNEEKFHHRIRICLKYFFENTNFKQYYNQNSV